MSKLHPLYSVNDKSAEAFHISEGELIFEFSDLGQHKAIVNNMLAGTVEYFLPAKKNSLQDRLFSLTLKSNTPPSRVPLASLSKKMSEFDFGFLTNQFLALTLKLANEAHKEVANNLPPAIAAYEARARIFARLMNNIYLIGKRKPVQRLIDYAQEHMHKVIYKYGAKLIREQRLANLTIPSTPVQDFVQEMPKGSVLCKEGDSGNIMYVLLKGKVGVVIGGRYVAYITEPGEAFGEASLFLSGRRTASLYAEEDSTIYAIEDRDLDIFYDDHPEMFLAIASTFASRISDTIDSIGHFCRSLQITQATELYASWEKKNHAAEKLLERLYKEMDEVAETEDVPEIQELWEKFVGKSTFS